MELEKDDRFLVGSSLMQHHCFWNAPGVKLLVDKHVLLHMQYWSLGMLSNGL